MNLANLRTRHEELLSYMKATGYSAVYIHRFQKEIKWILQKETQNQWASYADIYLEHTKVSKSKDYLRNKRTIIGALEQFDVYGCLPDGRRRHTLFKRGSYHLLVPEFRELIDFYCTIERLRGKQEGTIRGESLNATSFLYAMQLRGCHTLGEVTEDDALSFFISDEGSLIRGCSYKKNISAVFKAGLGWKEKECNAVLNFLPMLRENRKNIQYLNDDEIALIRKTIDTGNVSMRNKAIIQLLLYTGLRGCDIASMRLDSVDWNKEKILVNQQKTKAPLELPLSIIVGNAIFEYLVKERPDTENCQIFLSETKPFTPLSSKSISNVVAKIFKAANLRQTTGERKGTHIFRHHLASSMLERGISRPVITQTLGHTAPNSLEPYLKADFVHLKECAVSIDAFPIAEEVFCV